MNNAKYLFLACGISLSLLAVTGCGKKDAADLVRQRAAERWDLLGGKHAVKAYDYLSPGYRSTHTLEQYVAYVATARVQWKSAKVESVQCEDDICTVKLTVASVLPGAALQRPSDMEYTAPVVEKWVRGDGQWYFLPESKIQAKSIGGQAEASEGKTPAAAPGPASDASAGADSGKEGHK